MSQPLIARSPDLRRLRDEGYDIEVRGGHLVVKRIPYVDSDGQVRSGTLASVLTLAGDVTTTPDNHVVYFDGEYPCNADGMPIEALRHETATRTLDENLVVQHSFSNKPPEGYRDYHHKMTNYAGIISDPAVSLDASVTVTPFPVVESGVGESVFTYLDTASSRAGINIATKKLEVGRVAIVGLGGTGSYILDLVAKTPVREIHIFDGDRFSQHNAFRAPGAASVDELRLEPQKVEYLSGVYSRMHRGIVAHNEFASAGNLDLIASMDFVFLSLDGGLDKRDIVERLERDGRAFVDVGMGVELVEDSLLGIVRVTTGPGTGESATTKGKIPFTDGGAGDEYTQNIQIADLNALNAALAVIRWKKLCGFYLDSEHELDCTYTVSGNLLLNESQT